MSRQWLEHFPCISSRSTVWGKIQPIYTPAMHGEMLQSGGDTLNPLEQHVPAPCTLFCTEMRFSSQA